MKMMSCSIVVLKLYLKIDPAHEIMVLITLATSEGLGVLK